MAKNDGVKRVTVPKLNLGQITLRIEGDLPGLLQNKRPETVPQKGESKAIKLTPEEQWQAVIHYLPEAHNGTEYGHPVSGLMKCIEVAVIDLGFKGKTEARRWMQVVAPSGTNGLIPLYGGPPFCEHHQTRNRNKGGGLVDLYRPCFAPGWYMDLEIRFNKAKLNEQSVVNIVQYAGFAVGIGDARKELCNLGYGCFHVMESES